MYHQRLIDKNREKVERELGFGLIEHSPGQVQDFLLRLRKTDWDPETGEPSRELTDEEQRFIVNEIYFSRISFPYWCQRYATVLTDKKRLSPLTPWPSQEKFFKAIAEEEVAGYQDKEAKKIKIILLKSRQVGGTAASEAILAHMVFLNARTQGIIASDHPDNTQKLWQTLLRMYDNMPGWMKPHRDAKVKATHLHLDRMESDVIAGSGNQKTTLGQGMNVDVAHLTEVSTWDPGNAVSIDEDLMPAFDSSWKHHSILMLESTAAGATGNWFYEKFQSAQKGLSRMKPVFIAWYLRPGWKASDFGVTFSKQTLDMADRVRRETGMRLSREQMAWYQMQRQSLEAEGKLELFFQEFPSTVEEAFQTGLRSAFPVELRAKVRDACRAPIAVFEVLSATKKLKRVPLEEWIADPLPDKANDKLVVWEWAKAGQMHIIGVDASYGMDGGDSAAVEVMRVGNTKLGDEQVAEYRGSCSPLELASVCEIIGNVYKDKLTNVPAMLAIECNPGSPGLITQTELMRRNYQNFYVWTRPLSATGAFSREFGWWTTPQTRPLMTEMGVEYIKKSYLQINSPFFVDEMASFVNVDIEKGKKKLAHAPGKHDDRIIALFIALYVAHDRDNTFLAEERRRLSEAADVPREEIVEFQSLGIPWSEALARWEAQFLD